MDDLQSDALCHVLAPFQGLDADYLLRSSRSLRFILYS
jgi:hypothetical protein